MDRRIPIIDFRRIALLTPALLLALAPFALLHAQQRGALAAPLASALALLLGGALVYACWRQRRALRRQRAHVAERLTQLERSERALRVVRAASRSIHDAADETALLTHVCDALVEAGGYQFAWVGEVREQGQPPTLLPLARAGDDRGLVDDLLADHARERDEPTQPQPTALIERDLSATAIPAHWRAEAVRRGFASCTCLPLAVGDHPYGQLTIFSGQKDAFHVDEMELLGQLVDDVVYGLGVLRERSARRRAEQERARLAALVEATPDFIGITDPAGTLLYHNPAAARLLGEPPHTDLRGRPLAGVLPGWAQERLRQEGLPTALRAGIWEGESALCRTDGSELPIAQTLLAHQDADGTVNWLSTIGRDISDRKRAEAAAQAATAREEHFANVVINGLPGLYYLVDQRGHFHRWNHEFQRVTGYSPAEIAHLHPLDLVPPESRAQAGAAMQEMLQSGFSTIETDLVTRTGRRIPYFFTGTPVVLDGITYINGTAFDIADRKQAEELLRRLATEDRLTRMANRLRLEQYLDQLVKEVERYHRPLSLIIFDVDHFKRVNDRFGHDTGDRVLQGVCELVRRQLRDSDLGARWGGEEFVIVTPETPLDGALQLGERIRQAVADHDFDQVGRVTLSFGIAEYTPGEGADRCLKRADEALYRAKNNGRNRVEQAA